LNARTAPSGIGLPHLPNQRDQVGVNGGSSPAGPGFPAPKEAKAQAMPRDDGLGSDEEQGLLPVGPEAQQTHPQQSVGGPEFRFGRLPGLRLWLESYFWAISRWCQTRSVSGVTMLAKRMSPFRPTALARMPNRRR